MTEKEFHKAFFEHTNKTVFAVKCEVAAQIFQAMIMHYPEEHVARKAWKAANAFMVVAAEEFADQYRDDAIHQPSHHS